MLQTVLAIVNAYIIIVLYVVLHIDKCTNSYIPHLSVLELAPYVCMSEPNTHRG